MQLTIRFGLDLDGYRSMSPASRRGEVTLGPLGLLTQLETRLGLHIQEPASAMRRATRYLQCLQQADTGHRFYSRSLAVDPLSVAHTLLSWRDQWVGSGWNGAATDTDAERLVDMAAVETRVSQTVPPGIADRLRDVAQRLESCTLPLAVEVVDPVAEFPALWQRILQHLGATEMLPEIEHTPPTPDTDLARLQEALTSDTAFTPQGDGSLLLIEAVDQQQLARAVSGIVAGNLPKNSCCHEKLTTQLVSEKSLAFVDPTLWCEDLPLTGCSDASAWRPPLQVLPLAMSFFWEPLDPYRLLEFLAHPICPVPAPARYQLADLVAEVPGIGSERWQEELEKISAAAIDKAEGDATAGKILLADIDSWLKLPRFDATSGAPIAPLAEHCARLSRWMSRRAAQTGLPDEQKALCQAAAAQAREAQRCLDDWPDTQQKITRLQCERLLEEVTASGTPIPETRAELGSLPLLPAPGAAIAPVERLLWWDFTEPLLPVRCPWSAREIADLARQGTCLPSPQQQFTSLQRRWQRAIFATTGQLILLQPLQHTGESLRQHPLGNLLSALCNNAVPTIDLSAELGGTAASMGLHLPLEAQSARQLPPLRRWWTVDQPQLLAPRQTESFSSLQAFVNSPYQWVLNYKARLRSGSLRHIADGAQLKGSLLHRLVELLLTNPLHDGLTLSPQELDGQITTRLDALLVEEGAVFLLPGHQRDKQALYDLARRSIRELVQQLRSAKVVSVKVEEHVTGNFCGGQLAGSIDLLVTNSSGQEAVVDLKLGGTPYRSKELKENRALQLALYAWLRKKNKRWPAQAFYIFQDSSLLAHDRDYFPEATLCRPIDDGASAASLWLEFEKAWAWRRQQLDSGLVEVTVTGTEPDDQSQPPIDALEIPPTSDRFNDFATLTGWEERA